MAKMGTKRSRSCCFGTSLAKRDTELESKPPSASAALSPLGSVAGVTSAKSPSSAAARRQETGPRHGRLASGLRPLTGRVTTKRRPQMSKKRYPSILCGVFLGGGLRVARGSWLVARGSRCASDLRAHHRFSKNHKRKNEYAESRSGPWRTLVRKPRCSCLRRRSCGTRRLFSTATQHRAHGGRNPSRSYTSMRAEALRNRLVRAYRADHGNDSQIRYETVRGRPLLFRGANRGLVRPAGALLPPYPSKPLGRRRPPRLWSETILAGILTDEEELITQGARCAPSDLNRLRVREGVAGAPWAFGTAGFFTAQQTQQRVEALLDAKRTAASSVNAYVSKQDWERATKKYEELAELPNVMIDAAVEGDSALHLSVRTRSYRAAQALLDSGVDPGLPNADGDTLVLLLDRFREDLAPKPAPSLRKAGFPALDYGDARATSRQMQAFYASAKGLELYDYCEDRLRRAEKAEDLLRFLWRLQGALQGRIKHGKRLLEEKQRSDLERREVPAVDRWDVERLPQLEADLARCLQLAAEQKGATAKVRRGRKDAERMMRNIDEAVHKHELMSSIGALSRATRETGQSSATSSRFSSDSGLPMTTKLLYGSSLDDLSEMDVSRILQDSSGPPEGKATGTSTETFSASRSKSPASKAANQGQAPEVPAALGDGAAPERDGHDCVLASEPFPLPAALRKETLSSISSDNATNDENGFAMARSGGEDLPAEQPNNLLTSLPSIAKVRTEKLPP
eukprot:scaffold1948_cov244-Pinguiococcus_pyrenoidosus.AAC.8